MADCTQPATALGGSPGGGPSQKTARPTNTKAWLRICPLFHSGGVVVPCPPL